MSKQVYRIEAYTFSSVDALLFDANIWLYIYGPQRQLYPRLHTTYNLAFRRIRSVKSRIFSDVIVLSEFINSYARIVYNDLPVATKPANFKTFRNSADFKPVAEDIAEYSQRIVEKTERTDSGYDSVDVRAILSEYADGNIDFNDRMLAELCRAKGLKLVTHDGDFQGENLTIITANPRLLR